MDAELYNDKTNVPHHKAISYRFTVDAGNAPTLAASPANLFVRKVERISQGLFRVTLVGSARSLISHRPVLNVNAAAVARWAQPGPVANAGTATDLTVDILIVDNAGAVQDPPAANANNFVSGEIVLCDVSSI